MAKTFEELDYRQTPMGELVLRRRTMLSLGGQDVYEVKLGEEFLMSSLFHEAEIALSDLGLAEAHAPELDVVVGGLGLGYTAVAALKNPRVRSLLVVDALDAVIEWHQQGLVPLGPQLTGDRRTRLIHADFFAMAAAPERGFDPENPGRRFHAVLLDVDHSPGNVLHERHRPFYEVEGLRRLSEQLHPGGVFALWSNDPPEAEFSARLDAVFGNSGSSRAHLVEFQNPLTGGVSSNSVYVARRPE